MDMLKVFFEKTNEDTSVYFKDKKIWACGKEYQEHQGKYPVIFISFKDTKYDNWKEAYDSITARLNFLREQGSNLVPEIIKQLEKDMKEGGVIANISGREKSPYSIWRKMQRQNISFEQICDIMAFRIVVPTVADCYHVLGLIHTKYPYIMWF